MNSQAPYTLLTGATGLIGSQLLARLMRRHVPLVVLTRRHEKTTAVHRIEAILQRFEQRWQRNLARPVIVEGDLTEPGLGLSEDDRHTLVSRCSSIIHMAASLSFRPADPSKGNEPYRTNLEGTRELLSLWANAGIDTFHHVSTAYVCGTLKGRFAENDLDLGQEFANDYERSKFLTEQMLRASASIDKLTIYRPSIVIDTSGDSPSSQDRTLYVALAMYRTMATKFGFLNNGDWFEFLGCEGTDRKNIVEASWVADVIEGIFADTTLHGETYNLTAEVGTAIEDIEHAFKRVVESSAVRKEVNASRKSVATGEAPNIGSRLLTFSKNAISRKSRTIAETIAGPYIETFSPYFRNDPVFVRTNLTRALKQIGLNDQPAVGADSIRLFAIHQQTSSDADTELKLKNRRANASLESSTPRGLEPLWSERITELQLLDASSQTDLAGQQAPSEGWGIVISGPGGTDFQVYGEPLMVLPCGQACSKVLYLCVDAWDQLMYEQVALDDLIKQGGASIESESDLIETDECIALLAKLMDELRHHFLVKPRKGVV